MKITEWAIGCDTHITEPGDVWTTCLPAEWTDRAPRMIRTDDGTDQWRFGDYERPVPVGAPAVAGWPEPFPSMPQNMDEIGVWASALYPNIGGFERLDGCLPVALVVMRPGLLEGSVVSEITCHAAMLPQRRAAA